MVARKYSGLPHGPPDHKSVITVEIDGYRITTLPKKSEWAVVHVRHPERGTFILSFADGQWACAHHDFIGNQHHIYSQTDGDPPKYAAPYIQKAYQAMHQLQKDAIALNISMEGFEELHHLKNRADAVLESASAGGGGAAMKAPVVAQTETQLAKHPLHSSIHSPPRMGA